jgi:hypothetical protein
MTATDELKERLDMYNDGRLTKFEFATWFMSRYDDIYNEAGFKDRIMLRMLRKAHAQYIQTRP